MTSINNAEALLRLKALLAGQVVVEEEVMPRLVQALVRLAGRAGEELFGEQLRTSKVSHMAARLSAMSVMVLGNNAVRLLVEGTAGTVDLARIRATGDVLAGMGTKEAHQALTEIAKNVRHPVGRELVLAKIEELERAYPTRFALLPRLLKLEEEDSEKLYLAFLAEEDKQMCRLLLQVLPTLDTAKAGFAYRVLGARGDKTTALHLQSMLPTGPVRALLDDYSNAMREIIKRIPSASEDNAEEWRAFYAVNKESEAPAVAAAQALTANPALCGPPLLEELTSSPFEEARLLAYGALTALRATESIEPVRKGLASNSTREIAAAAKALALLGDQTPLEELAKSKSSGRRAVAATASLGACRRDLWLALAVDDERAVRQAAIHNLAATPADERPTAEELAPIISHTKDYDNFEELCRILGAIGDLESVRRLVGRIKERETLTVVSVLKALRALRVRGIYRLSDLGEEGAVLTSTMLEFIPEQTALSLLASLLEDFELEELENIRNSLLAQPVSVKVGAVQALTVAVIGRLHLVNTRRRIAEEIETLMHSHPASAREQIEAVNRVASLWLRSDVEMGEELSDRIENWLITLANEKTLARIARKAALDTVGKAGSVKVFDALVRLRASPTEEIELAAASAIEQLARRFPNAVALPGGDEGRQRQTVLIVEDDENTRSIYQTFLSQKGFTAMTACDGEEALGAMGSTHADVVLLDLEMDGMDGYGFLKALETVRAAPPVVVITSHGDRTTVLNVLRLGAVDFMKKPVDLPEMLGRVRRLLGRRAGHA